MRKRTIVYLALAFIILLAIYYITMVSNRAVEKKTFLVEVDTNKVDYIHIVSPTNNEVTLQKVNYIWRITNPLDFQAEQRFVHDLMQKLTEMEIESQVSNRVEQQKTYDVDDSSAVKLELKQGNKLLASILMGKPASTYRHTYFRLPNSKDIFMVKGMYKYFIDRKINDWRNKVILELNKDAVEDFSLIYPKETITAAVKDTVWTVSSGKVSFTADKSAIDRTLNFLTRLRAGDFYDPQPGKTAPDFSKPNFALEVTYDGGQKQTLYFLPEDKEQKRWYVKKADDNVIYIIYKGSADMLMRKLDDFKPGAKENEAGRPAPPTTRPTPPLKKPLKELK